MIILKQNFVHVQYGVWLLVISLMAFGTVFVVVQKYHIYHNFMSNRIRIKSGGVKVCSRYTTIVTVHNIQFNGLYA